VRKIIFDYMNGKWEKNFYAGYIGAAYLVATGKPLEMEKPATASPQRR
jgi:hypothetical protein